MTVSAFDFGVEGLDSYYPNVLIPGTLLVIAGHPGSGKTTLAAQLCYHNALKRRKCLYVSTQESEEKFHKFMRRFGFDFEYLTASGFFRFSRLPLISSEEALDGVLESITSMVLEFNPKILVVDSVTPMTKVASGDAKRRALIQNFFYNIAFEIGGLVVLIAEMPLGEHTIREAGDVEFVADGILILKHEIVNGMLSRRMEVRKLRGSPLDVSEIPFTITPEGGIKVLVPPRRLAEKVEEPAKRYKLACEPLDEALGSLEGGEYVLLAGLPYEVGLGRVLKWILRVAGERGARVAIVSYREPEDSVKAMVERAVEGEPRLAGVGVRVIHVNPALLGVEAVFSQELDAITLAKPDIVVFLDVDALAHFHRVNPMLLERYLRVEKATLRNLKALAFRVSRAVTLDSVSWELPLAEAIIYSDNPFREAEGRVTVWRASSGKKVLKLEGALEGCF